MLKRGYRLAAGYRSHLPIIAHCHALEALQQMGPATVTHLRDLVLDDREAFSNPERFPMAAETHAGPFEEILTDLEPGPNAYVVIVTRGHRMDGACLAWAARTSSRYIGMIGSKRKIRAIYDLCREAGITEEQLARVHAPIGLSIGALTSEEIAIAIVAQLIAIRRAGE